MRRPGRLGIGLCFLFVLARASTCTLRTRARIRRRFHLTRRDQEGSNSVPINLPFTIPVRLATTLTPFPEVGASLLNEIIWQSRCPPKTANLHDTRRARRPRLIHVALSFQRMETIGRLVSGNTRRPRYTIELIVNSADYARLPRERRRAAFRRRFPLSLHYRDGANVNSPRMMVYGGLSRLNYTSLQRAFPRHGFAPKSLRSIYSSSRAASLPLLFRFFLAPPRKRISPSLVIIIRRVRGFALAPRPPAPQLAAEFRRLVAYSLPSPAKRSF